MITFINRNSNCSKSQVLSINKDEIMHIVGFDAFIWQCSVPESSGPRARCDQKRLFFFNSRENSNSSVEMLAVYEILSIPSITFWAHAATHTSSILKRRHIRTRCLVGGGTVSVHFRFWAGRGRWNTKIGAFREARFSFSLMVCCVIMVNTLFGVAQIWFHVM